MAGPVALLLGATVVALGARALLHDDARSAPAARPSATQPAARARRPQPPPARPPTPPPAPPAPAVVVESGDTLGAIAAQHGTTVDELLALNPGVDPAALRVGQRIRLPAASR